jgi:hypothetical protein
MVCQRAQVMRTATTPTRSRTLDPGPDPEVPTLMGSMMSTTKPLSSRLLSIDTTEKPTTNTTLTLKPPSATQTRHSFSKRLDAQHIDIANLPPIQQPHH